MFYIVAKGTGLIVSDGPNRSRAYKTYGAARATRTRLCNKKGYRVGDLSIVDIKYYKPQMVTRTNLMTGQEYEEDVNTPNCCSPSSETFWSM